MREITTGARPLRTMQLARYKRCASASHDAVLSVVACGVEDFDRKQAARVIRRSATLPGHLVSNSDEDSQQLLQHPARCAIVDSEPGVRMMISLLLESVGILTCSYASGEQFLEELATGAVHVSCLILDLGLAGVSGLEVLAKTRKWSSDLPVIVISGTASFADAACAFQGKANAMFAKPIDTAALLEAVQALVTEWSNRSVVRREIRAKLATLSPREREVLDALVEGKNTSQIAHALSISPSTVEKHRLRVFDKTGIDSVVGLVHWLLALK